MFSIHSKIYRFECNTLRKFHYIRIKMDFNYTSAYLSWSPTSENSQFQQIKGLTGFLLFLIISIGLVILKYIKFNAKKILKSNVLEEGVLTEIIKLQNQVEIISHAQRPKNDTPDYIKKYGFDPRVCTSCKSEDECPHDTIDGEESHL